MLTLTPLCECVDAHQGSMETARMNRLTVIALVAVVTVLMMVQVPLDLRTHRLSRTATTFAGFAVGGIIAIDAVVTGAISSVGMALLVTIAVTGVYGTSHRMSPRSLGWGDVLLVAPLTLTLAYLEVEHVLWWQLMAATTGAVHAVWVRVRSGSTHVPFGPHLLIAAWLMLVASV